MLSGSEAPLMRQTATWNQTDSFADIIYYMYLRAQSTFIYLAFMWVDNTTVFLH